MVYPARSILILDASPFGRSLALLPAVRALRTSYAETLLVAASTTGTCELLREYGLVDETIDLGLIKSFDRGKPSAIKRFVSLARRSRRYDIDLVLDFSPRLETQIVSRLFLRARTISPSRLPRAVEALLGIAGRSRHSERSAFSDHAAVLEQAGVEMPDTRFGIEVRSDEDLKFERLLARSGSRGGELIALLYASDVGDRRGWPGEAFAEVGTRLTNNLGARIIVADQPSDDAFTEAVSTLLPSSVIKLKAPRALELVAAVARASMVVTDEPAVAQLATELATPVVEIAESVRAGNAFSNSHRVVHGLSRARVSSDEVYGIACEVIQESRSPSLFHRP